MFDNVEISDVFNSDLVSVNDIVCFVKIECIEKEILIFIGFYFEKEKMLGKFFNFFCKLNKEGWDGYNVFFIE